MQTLAHRLTHLMQVRNIKRKKDLADAANVSPSAVTQWFKGDTKELNAEPLMRLARHYRVRVEWLQHGRLPMEVEEGELLPAQLGFKRVPVISYVQAGDLAEAIDAYPVGVGMRDILTSIDVSDCAFALEVDGLSMLPEFSPGDIIVVDPLVSPMPGSYVVAKNCDEKATFKKYRPRGISQDGNEIFELVPLNPDFPTLYSDRQHLVVIGTVVEHRRNLLGARKK